MPHGRRGRRVRVGIMSADPALNQVAQRIASLYDKVQQERFRKIQREAEEDPKKHKLTRVMAPVEYDKLGRRCAGGTNYRYYNPGVLDGRGSRVLFCYSTGRNVAGYFLSWRQVEYKNGTTKRFDFAARRVRKRAAALAERRCQRFRERQEASS